MIEKLVVPLKTSSEKVSSTELLNDLENKTLKYSIMAITNILIKTDKTDLIFFRKLSILQVLQEHCQFEHNPQMNLRFVYLIYISLSKQKLMQKNNIQPKEQVEQVLLEDGKDAN